MKIIEILNRKWVLPLLEIFWNDPQSLRFSELENKMKEDVSERISAKVLSERLSELTGMGIIHRERDFFNPKHVMYNLTELGESLRDLFDVIKNFDDELSLAQNSVTEYDTISNNVIA